MKYSSYSLFNILKEKSRGLNISYTAEYDPVHDKTILRLFKKTNKDFIKHTYEIVWSYVNNLQIALDGIFDHFIAKINNEILPNHSTPAKPANLPSIKNVIFNYPATIVLWADGTKTIVKSSENDIYDPEKGLAMAIAKKCLGNNGNYYETFKKWMPKENLDEGMSELSKLLKALITNEEVEPNEH